MLGDSHVYSNHVEPLKEQLQREPRPFPTLEINPGVKDIDDFKFEDFTITGYAALCIPPLSAILLNVQHRR